MEEEEQKSQRESESKTLREKERKVWNPERKRPRKKLMKESGCQTVRKKKSRILEKLVGEEQRGGHHRGMRRSVAGGKEGGSREGEW